MWLRPLHWLCACGLVISGCAAAQNQDPVADFSSLLRKVEFVDKTLFINAVFATASKKILLTAPSRTGKSTLVDMTRRFLEIEVNETGSPLTMSRTRKESVQDTPNYRMFADNRLKIADRLPVMGHYLGKYPVIHADFKCAHDIDNSDNAVVCFRQVVHEAFKRHRYLRKSDVLNTKEKRLVKKWSDSYGAFETFYGQDVTNSLYKLAIILCKHFGGRKVFVLVDNYEYPTTRAMFRLKNKKELERVIKFNLAIIAKLLSADYRYVDRAVVVGLSRAAADGADPALYDAGLHFYGFLGVHPFAEHFGLTGAEVERLFAEPAFALSAEQRETARYRYGGFESRSGLKLHALYSTLQYLQTGEARNYIVVSGLLKKLGRLFKIPFVRENVEAMIVDGGVATISNIDYDYSIDDIFSFVNVVKLKIPEHFKLNLIFTFLQEQGYFSYVPDRTRALDESNSTGIKIPNDEIKTVFALKLKDYYDGVYKIDKTLLRKSASFFDSVSPSLTGNKIHFKRALYWFYNSLQQLVSGPKRITARRKCDVCTIIFSVMHQVNVKFDGKSRITVQNNDNGLFSATLENPKFRFVVEARTDSVSSDVLNDVVRRLQPMAMPMAIPTKRCVMIGVGVSHDGRTSLSCCLLQGANISDAIHLP